MLTWRMSRDGRVTSEGRTHPPRVFILQEADTVLYTTQTVQRRAATNEPVNVFTQISRNIGCNIMEEFLQFLE